jgi:hypothetical protein
MGSVMEDKNSSYLKRAPGGVQRDLTMKAAERSEAFGFID